MPVTSTEPMTPPYIRSDRLGQATPRSFRQATAAAMSAQFRRWLLAWTSTRWPTADLNWRGAVADRFSTSLPAWTTAHAQGCRMEIARRGSLTGHRPERHHVVGVGAADVCCPRGHDRTPALQHASAIVGARHRASDAMRQTLLSDLELGM